MSAFHEPPLPRVEPEPVDASIPVPVPANAASLQFLDRPGLPQLLVRNLLFGALTLGFYRFWAKTNLRRFLWASVVIDGEPLEYTGRARELLIGFLIVMAIFVPLSVGYSALQTMLLDTPAAGIILSIVYAVGLYLLINAAIWRARRYRLLRTLWRGIRAGQDGSTWIYMGKAALWLLLVPLSLGLALPWALADLARYRIEHTLWGQFRGRFTGTGRGLLGPWLLVMALSVLPFVACLAGVAVNFDWGALPEANPRQIEAAAASAGRWLTVTAILAVVGAPFLYAWFTVRWQRWYLGHTEIGPLHFSSRLRARSLIWRGILLLTLPPVFLAVMIALGFTAAMAAHSHMFIVIPVVFVFLLIGWGGFRLLGMLVFYVPVLRRVIEAITVENLAAAGGAQQSQQPDVRFGEGLADSFEIGIV
ncbi:DUF898 family protein [Ferrovibrio xuzhouensis]|uniref:DUF898 family protein n=1 Tax=Ferrovibrio xuzhouensis TaxID=1576914 RepID=A0ABV7VG87_9PROT